MNVENIDINVEDLEILLMSSMRYAMGRQTYIVGETCGIIKQYWKTVRGNCKTVLRRDLTEAIDRVKRAGGFLGADFDHAKWEDLLKFMDAN